MAARDEDDEEFDLGISLESVAAIVDAARAVQEGEDRRTSPRTTRPKSASPRLTRDTLCARQEALNAIGGRCTIREHPVTVARDRSASRFGPSFV